MDSSNICYTSFEKVTCWGDFVQENMSWNLHFYYGLTGKYLNFCSQEALLYSRQEGQNGTEVIHTWRKKEVHFFKHLVLFLYLSFLSAVFVSCLQPHQLWVEIHMGSPVWMPHVEAPVGSARRPVGWTDNQVASTVHLPNAQFRNPVVDHMFLYQYTWR